MNISRIRTTCIRNQLKMLQNVQIWTIWILERGAYFIYSLYEEHGIFGQNKNLSEFSIPFRDFLIIIKFQWVNFHKKSIYSEHKYFADATP